MSHSISCPRLLAAALAATLAMCAAGETLAQSPADRAAERRARAASGAAAEAPAADAAIANDFPNATREEPGLKASARLGPKLQDLSDAFEAGDEAKTRELADELIAAPKANAYEKAIAARIVGAMMVNGEDADRGQAYLQQALDLNGLTNQEHYGTMAIIAQLQMQGEKYDAALSTADRLIAESKSDNPEYQVLKGNALYRLERYPEAIAVLKPVVEASSKPRADWTQLLMASYSESGQPQEAAKLAEQVASGTPADKAAQLNLAAVYMQGDRTDKAIGVYEGLRGRGELSEDREYRNLVALYMNSEGKEAQAIEVINDGLAKGVLKPDHQTYVALAQAYYFSDQTGPAIEAYQKAAPLAPSGETYLNLAKVLANEGRTAESKEAAQKALDKGGLKSPDDARKLLAR